MLEKGKKINDRYEIISVIGEGGMANVFLATDLILGRKVAIKVLRGDLATNEKFVRRFQREAVAASNLCHQNIVSIYDVLEENKNHYIVMEYIEGLTLKQLIKKRGKLTISEAIDIMLQLLNGITHAHESFIIHRDIKPQNILILSNGLVKIADFGIAASLNESELTQTNSVMGSVYYLPPEQASGTMTTLKSDIYSLGIVMFEMLTGKLPFKGENAVEIAMKHINDTLPSVREINPQVPQSLENIILKATAKNVKNRYDSAKEMKEDLENALNPENENTKVIKHKYKENFNESNTKVLNTANKNKDLENSFMEDFEPKNSNKVLISLCIIISMILISTGIYFMLGTNKESTKIIPNLLDMSANSAKIKLEELGFNGNITIEEQYSDTIKAGEVINTNPKIGDNIKLTADIIIYKSKGTDKIVLEDYTNLKYAEVKAKLELLGLKVEIELKEVDVAEYESKEGIVIGQSPKVGSKLDKEDTIYLHVPNIYTGYPDMTLEKWSKEDVSNFAKEYNLSLTIEYKEIDDELSDNVVLSQNRAPKSKIVKNANFSVVIGKYKEPTPPVEPEKPDGNKDDESTQTPPVKEPENE